MILVKIPFSQGSLGKNIGCEKAPDEIIKSLYDFYSNESGRKNDFSIDEVKVTGNNIDKDYSEIYLKAKESFKDKFMFIGGDHSITYSCFKGFSEKFSNAGMLIFDAHPDCYLSGKDFLNHENFIAFLVNEGILKHENAVIVGIRNWHKNEFYFLKEKKIRYFTMKQVYENINDVCDIVMEIVSGFDALYVSVDVDVVDPAFAPGTGYLEPGGMSSRELIYFLQRIKLLKNLKAVDLVEVNPDKDVNEMTIKLGAKIINEMI